MKNLFIFTLLVWCVLQAASQITKTKNSARKYYNVLRADEGPYDVVSVIDGSGSVTEAGHIFAKTAAQLTNLFYNTLNPFGPGGSRAALVKFSEVGLTDTVFNFLEHSTLSEINGGINDLVYDNGGWTAIGDGLHEALMQFVSHPSSNEKKVFLFTDGRKNQGMDENAVANILKFIGAQVCIVGVGPYIDQPALEALASVLDDGNLCVFIHDTPWDYYNALLGAIELLKQALRDQLRYLNAQVPTLKKLTLRKVKQAKRRARQAAKKVKQAA